MQWRNLVIFVWEGDEMFLNFTYHPHPKKIEFIYLS